MTVGGSSGPIPGLCFAVSKSGLFFPGDMQQLSHPKQALWECMVLLCVSHRRTRTGHQLAQTPAAGKLVAFHQPTAGELTRNLADGSIALEDIC